MASGSSSHVTWWMSAITDGVDDMVCIEWRELHARIFLVALPNIETAMSMAGKAEWKEAGRDCDGRSRWRFWRGW
jgi:hypothetical protein